MEWKEPQWPLGTCCFNTPQGALQSASLGSDAPGSACAAPETRKEVRESGLKPEPKHS